MCKNYKNNLQKSPEGAQKYVGSDVREGTCFPRKLALNNIILIKAGQFWWLLTNKEFLRNSQQHTTAVSHWIETTHFSNITAGHTTIFRHVWMPPFLSFLHISPHFFWKMGFKFYFLQYFSIIWLKVPRTADVPLGFSQTIVLKEICVAKMLARILCLGPSKLYCAWNKNNIIWYL